MSINHFGAEFFDSLNAPKDARLSASFASRNPCAIPPPDQGIQKGAPKKKGFSSQVGAHNAHTNESCFDSTRMDALILAKRDHAKIWLAFTEADNKLLTADQRMDVLAHTETGALLAVIRLISEDGFTKPFLTVLGLPTVAMQGSKAVIRADEFSQDNGVLEPGGIECPVKCRPILTTTLTQSRLFTSPTEAKLKLWKYDDSSLVLLKGEEAMEPIMIQDTAESKPAPGAIRLIVQFFIGKNG